ncbi:MAG: hypothetical protein ACJ72V_00780 [Nitrososphaeraceae archaeon]
MMQEVETDQQGQESYKVDAETHSNQTSEEGEEEVKREEDTQEEVKVAQDHELKVLPENEEEDKEEILITDATKRPPTAKTTKIINKKQRGGGRRRRKALPDEMTKVLNRQTVEIDKMALLVQSILKQLKPLKIQPELIKQLQSQLRQIQKQMSQIQKGIIITKKQQNKNKKKGE